uniref:Uncharacterized protein n=1 Tax=Panagrolaimus sp. ES5 TaxID=591445 RepID=A0AC34GD04_9BILA
MDNKEKIQPGSGDKAKAGPNAYGQGPESIGAHGTALQQQQQ